MISGEEVLRRGGPDEKPKTGKSDPPAKRHIFLMGFIPYDPGLSVGGFPARPGDPEEAPPGPPSPFPVQPPEAPPGGPATDTPPGV